ncbi:hypothetical protein COOONC_22310 [Cooperia oncophora]
MWLIDVVGRLGITLDRTVVLASSTTPLRLVDRILSHLDNRGVATTLYGKFPSFDLSLVSVVDRVSMLPSALRLHVLMLGVLTSGMYTVSCNAQPQVGKTSFAQLCATVKPNTFIDSAVCDVGAPFSWIAEDGKSNLQQAFSTTLMRRLC